MMPQIKLFSVHLTHQRKEQEQHYHHQDSNGPERKYPAVARRIGTPQPFPALDDRKQQRKEKYHRDKQE